MFSFIIMEASEEHQLVVAWIIILGTVIFGLFTETQKQELNTVLKPQMEKCKLAMTINFKTNRLGKKTTSKHGVF